MEKCSLQMKDIVKSYSGVTVLKRCQSQCAAGRNPRTVRRERGRQNDAYEYPGRSSPQRFRRDPSVRKTGKDQLPADSQALGIAFIHQELNVVNDLKVYENMFLGRELYKKSGILDAKRMCEETAKVFKKDERFHRSQRGDEDLQTSYKQIVEIAKALLMDAKLIIMDEPTTSLTQKEIG